MYEVFGNVRFTMTLMISAASVIFSCHSHGKPKIYLAFSRLRGKLQNFHKLDKIGNNINCGISGFTRQKKKNPATKCNLR